MHKSMYPQLPKFYPRLANSAGSSRYCHRRDAFVRWVGLTLGRETPILNLNKRGSVRWT